MSTTIQIYPETIPSQLVEACPLLPNPNPSEDEKRIIELAYLAAVIDPPVERI